MNIFTLLIKLWPAAKTVLSDQIQIGNFVKKYKLISFLTVAMLFATWSAGHFLFQGVAYGVFSIKQHKQLIYKDAVIERLRKQNARLSLTNEKLKRGPAVVINNTSDSSMKSGDNKDE